MIKNLKVDNVDCLHGTIVTVNNFQDYKNVYEVFMKEPFNENWDNQGLKEQFDYLKDNGEIIGFNRDHKIIGLLSILDGSICNHPFETDKTLYLPSIAIKEEYRGKGYARDLLNYFMYYFENQDYYNEVYYQERLSNPIINHLMTSYDFQVMENNVDKRKFLSKKR